MPSANPSTLSAPARRLGLSLTLRPRAHGDQLRRLAGLSWRELFEGRAEIGWPEIEEVVDDA